jgi:hypothetical protein
MPGTKLPLLCGLPLRSRPRPQPTSCSHAVSVRNGHHSCPTHLVFTVKHDGLPVVVRALPIPLLLILPLLRRRCETGKGQPAAALSARLGWFVLAAAGCLPAVSHNRGSTRMARLLITLTLPAFNTIALHFVSTSPTCRTADTAHALTASVSAPAAVG